jgi:hypothetical protein
MVAASRRYIRVGQVHLTVSLRGFLKLKINGAPLELKEWVGRSLFCRCAWVLWRLSQ